MTGGAGQDPRTHPGADPLTHTGSDQDQDGRDYPVVGFIGLGQMGAPMAMRLVGWPGGLIVYDARAEAMAPLVQAGARAASDPAEVASTASVISVMVRDDDQVCEVARAVATGTTSATPSQAPPAGPVPAAAAEPGGVGAAAAQVVLAIHSTISAGTATMLATELGPAGVEVIDAPVSGGFMGAHEGRLAVMVGGSREAYERCREPFGRWADLVVHLGPVGAGTRAKLARNLLHFVAFTAAAEAQRLAEAAGVDLRKLARIVRHSDAVTGGPGAIMLRPTTAPAAADDPLREVLEHVRALGEKDLSLALSLGADLGVDLPLAEFAFEHLAAGLGVPHNDRGKPDGKDTRA